MKKITKVSIGVAGTLAVAAPAITVPLVMKFKETIFDRDMYNANEKYSKKSKAVEYKSTSDDIIDTANEADINIYYTPAVAPFNNLLRLSMLSKKENHFFIIRDSERETFEDLVDDKKLQDFYNEGRVLDKKDEVGRSTVEDAHGSIFSTATEVLDKIHNIINKNPGKRINVWWNDTWVKAGYWSDRVLNLAGFSNVNVQLIEDGAGEYIDTTDLNNIVISGKWDVNGLDTTNEAAAAAMVDGVRSWYSSKIFLSLNSNKNIGDKSYNYFEYKELSDGIFNAKDSKGTRLMGAWPEITGLDWKHEAKMVMAADKLNGKPNLILLGSYNVEGEEKYIMSVWKRYHDEYNIFYKGHPGHMDHPLYVQQQMLDKHLDSMYQLEPMISSEQLTGDHVTPDKDGLHISFQKVIAVNWTSAITESSFPNLDITKDVIEIFKGEDGDGNLVYDTNPAKDSKSTNWGPEAGWLKGLVSQKNN